MIQWYSTDCECAILQIIKHLNRSHKRTVISFHVLAYTNTLMLHQKMVLFQKGSTDTYIVYEY